MSEAGDLARLARLAGERKEELEEEGRDGAAEWIYRNWYINPPPTVPETPVPYVHLGSALTATAQRAAPWETDWVVLSEGGDGSIVIGRGAIFRRELAGAYASVARPGIPPAPGEQVSVPAFLSWTDVATGQWAAQSPQVPQGPMVRVYVNVAPTAVGIVIDALLRCLARTAAPFSMKCPGLAAGFARADSLVIYLEASSWPSLEEPLCRSISESAAPLRPGIPALTRELVPGVGFAEDPGGGESFGHSRCAILAPVLLTSHYESASDLELALREALKSAGIDPARPWANPA